MPRWNSDAQGGLDEIEDAHPAVGGKGRGRVAVAEGQNRRGYVIVAAPDPRYAAGTGGSGMGSRRAGIAPLVAALIAQSSPALAQQAAPPATTASSSAAEATPAPVAPAPAAPAPAAPADVVELKSGALYRGTISEQVPGDHVEIVTLSGTTKRFPMSEVAYAGPESARPRRTPPAAPSAPPATGMRDGVEPIVTLHAREARLEVVASLPGVTLYRKAATAVVGGYGGGYGSASGYDVICTAPCDVSLPSGTHTLALSLDRRSPLEVDPVTLPAGRSVLYARYDKVSGATRAGGWVIFGLGIVGGGVVMFTADHINDDPPHFDGQQFALGGIIMGAGIAIGLVLALKRDHASIRIAPANAGRVRHATWSNPALDRGTRVAGAPGLALSARF